MNNDIYPDSRYIDEICNLFNENIYSKTILKKYTSKTQSDLLFETIDEPESKFIINNTKLLKTTFNKDCVINKMTSQLVGCND